MILHKVEVIDECEAIANEDRRAKIWLFACEQHETILHQYHCCLCLQQVLYCYLNNWQQIYFVQKKYCQFKSKKFVDKINDYIIIKK